MTTVIEHGQGSVYTCPACRAEQPGDDEPMPALTAGDEHLLPADVKAN
jgi:hypothetical protein